MDFTKLTAELLEFRLGNDPDIEPEWLISHLSDVIRYDPDGCFALVEDDTTVGMVTTTTYQDIAWLGWLFVLEEYRGRTFGAKLMTRAIDYVRARGARSILLEADLKAVTLYRRLGFVEQFRTQHYSLTRANFTAGRRMLAAVEPVTEADLEEITEFDRGFFHQSRGKLFELIVHNSLFRGFIARIESKIVGYLFATEALKNQQVGPLIFDPSAGADDEIVGALCREAFKACSKPLYFRCPMVTDNRSDTLATLGATRVDYHTLRMYLGDDYQNESEGVVSLGCPGKG